MLSIFASRKPRSTNSSLAAASTLARLRSCASALVSRPIRPPRLPLSRSQDIFTIQMMRSYDVDIWRLFMTAARQGVPEIDLSDIEVVRDPFTAYGQARERAPLAR